MKHKHRGIPKGKTDYTSLLVSLFLLLLPMLRTDGNFEALFSSVGRLHPVIVHFPIVLILSTAILEYLFGTLKGPVGMMIIKYGYNWSLFTSILACIFGYLLYSTGDYGGELVRYHLWSAIGVSLLLTWSIHFRKRYISTHRWRFRQISRTLLAISALLILFTGHQGGSLTHGPEYLTESITSLIQKRRVESTRASKNPESLLVFQEVITPAFKRNCMKCHNRLNSKSDLDLSSYEAVMSGGKSLIPMLVPGRPDSSELLRRIILPPKHDEYMPPDGKPPLDPAEVSIIEAWIQNGAGVQDTLGTLMNAGDTISQIINEYLPTLANDQANAAAQRRKRLKMGPKLARLGMRLGVEIRPDGDTDSAYYSVSMLFPPKIVDDDVLVKLMPYKSYFSKVSLVSSDVTDEGMYYLGQMPNLQELILAKSCIKGEGLKYLRDLPRLRVLNLSHTDLNNQQLLHLTGFPALEKVYLFNSFVTPEFLETFNTYMHGVDVSFEEGDYY